MKKDLSLPFCERQESGVGIETDRISDPGVQICKES